MTREEAERLVKRLVRACCESDYYHTIDDETEKLIAALAPAPHADDVALVDDFLSAHRSVWANTGDEAERHVYRQEADASRTALLARLRQRDDATQAATDVLAERERQKAVEGWTPEHDDEHDDGQLASAAACYALNAAGNTVSASGRWWPWAETWWKPTTPRRDLVKAGALILAEIERLDRAEARALKGK